MLLLDLCQSERHMLPPRSTVSAMPKLLLLALSGSMVLLQLESILMTIDYITTGSHNVLKYKILIELALPLISLGKANLPSLEGLCPL